MASPIQPFMEWMKTYLTAQSTFVTTEDNFLNGETQDLLYLDDDQFPRLECQIMQAPARDFVTQCLQDRSFTFSIQGFIRRTVPDGEKDDYITDQDTYDIAYFQHQVAGDIFNVHSLIQSGALSLPKFVKLSGVTESFIVLEIMPRISTFVLNFTAEYSFPANDRGD